MRSRVAQITSAIGLMSLMIAITFGFERWLMPLAGVTMLLLLAVVIIAFLTSFLGALTATIWGILSFNFLFTEPKYSLHMTDADEIFIALVFLVVAITISHLTTSFREQRGRLHQSQLRSNILLSVSHDLRTPLASIIGNLSTLKAYSERLAINDRNELLQAALDESDRLHRYIENLLQATRIQYGVSEVSFFDQDLRSLLAKSVKRFSEDQKARIKLSVPEEEVIAPIQSSLLEQALYNVVDNALTFSEPETPVQMTLKYSNAIAVIDIIDSGLGISKVNHQRVFDVFFSSRQKDSGKGGTGLGLPVSKGIINLHKGTIKLMKQKSGCHVRIELPLSRQENTDKVT